MKTQLRILLSIVIVSIFSACDSKHEIINGSVSSLSAKCDDLAIAEFTQSIHPVLVQNCAGCHQTGGVGYGAFADEASPTESFAVFQSKSFEKIKLFATDPAHQAPFTGAHLEETFSELEIKWQTAEAQVATCKENIKQNQNSGEDNGPTDNVSDCEDEKSLFNSTLHPFLVQNCASCHRSGGTGNGGFADPENQEFAFSEFQLRGLDLIADRALDPNHQPPSTGPQHQSFLDQITVTWQSEILACQEDQSKDTEPGMSLNTPNFVTTEKTLNGMKQTLSWSLPTEFSEGSTNLSFTASVDIEIFESVSGERTYHLSNPVISAGSQALYIARMDVFLNGDLVTQASTYRNLNVRIPANDSRVFSASTMIIATTPQPGDSLGISFSIIEAIDFAPQRFSQLMAQGGVLQRNCAQCHSGANPDGGLTIGDLGRLKGFQHVIPRDAENGTLIERMTSVTNPMPPTGRLAEQDLKVIRDWILDGAPE